MKVGSVKKSQGTDARDPFDPTVLPENVHRHILRYLTGKDLLVMTEVSFDWKAIAEDAKIEDKVGFKLEMSSNLQECNRAVSGSNRRYKKISYHSHQSKEEALFMETLDKFGRTVEDLSMTYDHNFINPDGETHHFPKLKRLVLDYNPSALEKWIMRCVGEAGNQLEELLVRDDIEGDGYDDDRRDEIVKFILKQRNLKRLHMKDLDSKLIRNYEEKRAIYGDLPFHLDSLHFYGWSRSCFFLLSQSESLQSLTIRDCTVDKLNVIINRMPKLTKLAIELSWSGNDEDFYDEDLQVNTSIKELEIAYAPPQIASIEKRLFLVLPELKSLDLRFKLEIELFEYIAGNLMKLENLSFQKVDEELVQRYKWMKAKPNDGINCNIRLFQRNYGFNARRT